MSINLKQACEQFNLPIPLSIQHLLMLRTFHEKEIILQSGKEIDGLYLLIEGRYYVTTREVTGKELLLRYCNPLSVLGDIEILQDCTIQSDCIASSKCTFIFIPLSVYITYLQMDGTFTKLLLKELAYKLQTCTISSRVNALASVEARFAAYLCTIYSDSSTKDYIFTSNLNEVASLIGTTKRHLNRIIKTWGEQDIITRTTEGIKIIDFAKLDLYSEDIRYE
ncbi:transcriptional regulator [Heyndrickxia shackletonii]|uniref:Transcriptional regulator n=1 Tax=Heyndrickxia shackletonii TaxID=157838 RepID=A0A0Q3WUZ3_9BACI|nr:Crp/Fnr family transcriptional regulator [Heyndrickxia shackletonii]KQL52295.1 transcriptional regulator [Heyndrickxia shackletonii]